MSNNENSAGLAGVTAGKTAVCTVGKKGVGLTYRGYLIEDLAAKAEFEEVAYLMLYGELPTQSQLDAYKQRLIGMRGLPDAVKKALELTPGDAHPMDVMRTGASVLGTVEQENDPEAQQHDVAHVQAVRQRPREQVEEDAGDGLHAADEAQGEGRAGKAEDQPALRGDHDLVARHAAEDS